MIRHRPQPRPRALATALPLALLLCATATPAPPARATTPAPAAAPQEPATMTHDPSLPDHVALVEQVRAAETAFAATMAARDHAAFAAFIAKEAVFFGSRGPLRGAEAVAAAWRRFFEGPQAPFSWRPETVEVLASGSLALTSGPVFEPDGTQSGTFTSIWRLEPDGRWRVVFDKGCPVCEAAKP